MSDEKELKAQAEEALKDLVHDARSWADEHQDFTSTDRDLETIRAYIAHLEANQGEWISVDKWLPQTKKLVVVYCEKFDSAMLASLYSSQPKRWITHGDSPGEITHWMPLPEPPSADPENV